MGIVYFDLPGGPPLSSVPIPAVTIGSKEELSDDEREEEEGSKEADKNLPTAATEKKPSAAAPSSSSETPAFVVSAYPTLGSL